MSVSIPLDTPNAPRPAAWKQRNHEATPEEIAAVQAPFGTENGAYPSEYAARLVLEVNGGNVKGAVDLFLGYLNKFDGSLAERVYLAATQDHDRGVSMCAVPFVTNGAEPVKPESGVQIAPYGAAERIVHGLLADFAEDRITRAFRKLVQSEPV